MHNIVLDTNVLVSALRSKHGVSQQIMRLIGQDHFRLNISVALALEYESVCKRKHLLPDRSEEDIDDLLDYLFTVGNLLPFVLRRRPILQDPRDECILESAIQSNSLIVTYNTRDFVGAERFGIVIKTPGEFLQILRADSKEIIR
jgi:putative PIN family toxin of toxin-antitoxin system